ncbi:rod shape-determining protein RodA [Thiomicrospira cyclica]|uniref:Peptidoglycan glycosyltransferase MrdB n=1 Tax=Thiomicrospira cyclica (strain DSM 14477 / JCM 11371 / ALM1) TaxID=717773 RepID=F6D995_THICA|nr:rod shape-determining protein RodA [Thiomicrospira cyclica]AEG32022.1 rod shape-determining protein RodA [Thiomicrospira cyclica ALM1]
MIDRFGQSQNGSPYVRPRNWLARLHLDGWLLFGLAILMTIGLMTIYSASGADIQVAKNHAIRMGIAIVLMIAFAQIPPAWLKIATPWFFFAGFIMLIAVLIAGDMGKGAQRWLDLGFVRFQPSEMMKIVLPMMIAWLFFSHDLRIHPFRFLLGILLTTLTAGMIFLQPDLGTSLLIAMSGLFVVFLAGLPWKLILGALAAILASAPIAWNFLHAYQQQRILTFLNPESDPLGSGYHIIQSKIAIGSGGIDGKGFLGSTQAHLEFLPESTTDFIFSVFAEEFGLIGVIGLLLVYLFILVRGLVIAYQAQERFTQLVAASFTLTFFVYILVNIGMVSGLFPVVGLPLPLMSYGGTSMVTLLISFGILMSIHTHKKLLSTNTDQANV